VALSQSSRTMTAPNVAHGFMMSDRMVLALLAILAVAARFVTYGNPALGFDEQFYLLVGDRMLHGELPYVDIFDRKPIGIFLIYAGVRLLGGEGFVQYKLVATLFVIATAWLIYLLGRQRAERWGAGIAAVLYILWLNLMEGEGGQTPVFYNLLVVGAAWQLFAAMRAPDRLVPRGALALLLIGLALQIKYTVVFEGMFFGLAFLWLAWTQRMAWGRLIGFAAGMVALALLPTALVLFYFWSVGEADAFIFANFLSIFGQGKGSMAVQSPKLAEVSALFLPLGVIAWFGRGALRADMRRADSRMLRLWVVTAAFGVLIYWRFNSPHYALPLLLPFCLLLAPALDARRRLGAAVALIVLVAGQIVQIHLIAIKGGNDAMRAVAAAAKPKDSFIFVYNGYPGLYMLTGSPLPSRWSFPGHFNAQDENNPRALGVDPVVETRRILDANPDAIVDTFPPYSLGNRETRALLHRVVAERYRPVLCVATRDRTRVIYRLKREAWPVDLSACRPEVFVPVKP
jgi:4-amino-4-deoxy-L-arabinose transferase-like glycosyltransferase